MSSETDAAAFAYSSGAARGQSSFQFHVLTAVWLQLTSARGSLGVCV